MVSITVKGSLPPGLCGGLTGLCISPLLTRLTSEPRQLTSADGLGTLDDPMRVMLAIPATPNSPSLLPKPKPTNYMKSIVELTNNFHNTSARVRTQVFDRWDHVVILLTDRQSHRVWKKLCGMNNCTCGGVRGKQEFYGKRLFCQFPK